MVTGAIAFGGTGAAAAGLLTLEELYAAKRLARDKYRPQTVWE